jgi:hypothetical protein
LSTPPPSPLLTVRAAVVLLTAVVIGLVAGGLGYLAHHDVATGVLIGGGAVGGALLLFHNLLGR